MTAGVASGVGGGPCVASRANCEEQDKLARAFRLPLSRTALALLAALLTAAFPVPAGAQLPPQPVYVDDSATATGALSRLPELIRSGNHDAAASQLNHLLTLDAERLAPSPTDPDIYVTVRVRCHQLLFADPKLRERYRAAFAPTAQELARQGQIETLERSYLFTPAGLDAALDLAQLRLESAAFHAALLTLQSLDNHPDLSGPARTRAAALAGELTRYLDSPLASTLAQRWGAGPQQPPVEWPVDARRIGADPSDPSPPIDDAAALAKSLWTVPIGAGPSVPITHVTGGGANGTPRTADEPDEVPLFARSLRAFPAVADDLIYVYDGIGIGAWDRFTLTRRWRTVLADPDEPTGVGDDVTNPMRGRIRIMRGNVPDPYIVTVRGRLIAVASGSITEDFNSDPPPAAIHLLDALSGRRLWTRRIGAVDPSLADAVVRGPVMVDQGLVIFAARRSSPSRRLVSIYLAALDAATGELRWRRLVGSAGSLPHSRTAEVLDGGVLADGVVYRGDQLGVFGAVEAHSGRPLWIRRFDVPASTVPTDTQGSHQLSLPIIDGPSVLTLSPNRQDIVRLDRATGALLSKRSVEPLGIGGAFYLVGVGDRLAVVGPTRVATIPIDGFESEPPRLSPLIESGIRGRVTAAGSKLLVPVNAGIASVDAAEPDTELNVLPLPGVGNVVPLGPQLVMVDDARLHNFLAWEPALRTLTERLERDPADATAAVTLTELAYRSGRHDSIIPMLDKAAGALAAAPNEPRNVLARRRLFDALMSMAHASLEPAPEATGPAGADPEQAADVRVSDAPLLKQIIDRAEGLAASPDERVAVVLVRGRSFERDADPVGAAGQYQAVLADSALANATWSGPRLTIRGDIEATWRLDRLIAEHGPQVYAPFDAQASAELTQLLPPAAPEPIERLMERFPLALAVPKAANALADAFESRGRGTQAVRALESGLRAALRRPDQDAGVIGALVERLATALESRDDLAAAVAVVRDAAGKMPSLTLPGTPTAVPISERLADLQAKHRQSHRWPHIGTIQTEGAKALPGWIIMRSSAPDPEPAAVRCVVMENADEVSLWRVEPGEGAHPSLVEAWSMPYEERMIDLLRVVGDTALLFVNSASRGAVVLRVSATSGGVMWTTPALSTLFASAPVPGDPDEQIVTPLDGSVRAVEPLVAMDERTVVVIDRAGRAAAFDAQTGQTLWFLGTPIVRVFDVSVRDGLVLLTGEQPTVTPGGATLGLSPGLMVLDARTGRQYQRIADLTSPVRWAVLTESRQIVAGLQSGLFSCDAMTPKRNWEISLPALTESAGGWFFGSQGYVIGGDRTLWLVDLERAQNPRPLDAPSGMFDEGKPISAGRIPAGVAFASFDGIVVFDAEGNKVGEDGLGILAQSIPGAFAEGLLLTADRGIEGESDDGLLPFNLRAFDTTSARLAQNLTVRLGANPRRIAVVDGMVILTAGHITITFPAP